MKAETELNAAILGITLMIQEKHPELTKYIEEMPVTIPDTRKPDINTGNLKEYCHSLVEMVKRYEKNTKISMGKNLSLTWKLIIAILICEGTGIISGLIASTGMNPWFDALNKPAWNPPAYLFAPV